jgi:hypothetical protein
MATGRSNTSCNRFLKAVESATFPNPAIALWRRLQPEEKWRADVEPRERLHDGLQKLASVGRPPGVRDSRSAKTATTHDYDGVRAKQADLVREDFEEVHLDDFVAPGVQP